MATTRRLFRTSTSYGRFIRLRRRILTVALGRRGHALAMAVTLFAAIVWRVWDVLPDGTVYRLSIATAWSVAKTIHLED